MKRTQAIPEEILQQRDELERMMLEADARAYVVNAWLSAGIFADFPIVPGGISYPWADFWRDEKSVLVGTPVVTVASAPLQERDTLRDRLGANRAPVGSIPDHIVSFVGRSSRAERPFTRLEGGAAVAEFDDGDTIVIVMSHRADRLPERSVVEQATDIQPLIENWKNA